jgi:hypothetical protein
MSTMAVMLAPGWFVRGGFYKIGEALVMSAVMAAVVLARRDERAYGGLKPLGVRLGRSNRRK